MKLVIIDAKFVDYAWRDGANALSEVCELTEEITGSQLKMILSRGERILVRLDDEETVGWGCFRIDQLPNVRVLHITDLVCHNANFERFFEEMKSIARTMGCSQIRCSTFPAQARIFKSKCGFSPVYETLKVEL